MRQVLIDTDIVSAFLKADANVVKHITAYLYHYDSINISIITKYEILSGLCHKDSHNKLDKFRQLLSYTNVLPLDDKAVEIASQTYAETRKIGKVVDDIDLLIASIALVNDMAIATNNVKHFSKINSLEIVNWMSD